MIKKVFYERICKCGDIATITYKPKDGAKCRSCASKGRGKGVKKPKVELKRHVHYCIKCGTLKHMLYPESKKKTRLCTDCSRSKVGTANVNKRKRTVLEISPEDISKMKEFPRTIRVGTRYLYLNICTQCDEPEYNRTIKSKTSVCGKCRKLNAEQRAEAKNERKASKRVNPRKKVSKEAIDKQVRLNRKHKEAVSTKVSIPKAKLTDEEMMKIYLSTHTVKNDFDVPIAHYIGYRADNTSMSNTY